jgi:hypothetical protein
MRSNLKGLCSGKTLPALLAAASLGVVLVATTAAEARIGGGRPGVGMGRVGSGLGFRPGVGVGRAGIGVRGWRNGVGVAGGRWGYGGGRWGYGGRRWGYGAAALTGAAIYGASNYGYGYDPYGYSGLYSYSPGYQCQY